MKNNYWNYNELIPTTEQDKRELLNYEVDMFRESCNQLMSGPTLQFKQNLLVESLAIHVRILVDFFYFSRKNKNDIIAQDLLPEGKDWETIKPPLTQTLEDAKEKAHKQLAHLSLWRLKLVKDGKKGWNHAKIKEDMENVIKKFEEARKN
ncbi:MAG: hypothetical protein Q8R12_04955 [bacterium]|nr:hypothetical protein [bacterium]